MAPGAPYSVQKALSLWVAASALERSDLEPLRLY